MWWLGGLLLAAASGALIGLAERAYWAGYPALEALAGVARIVLYLFWFHAAWKCSRNVEHAVWTYLARGTLLAGLLATAVLY
ncbi:MAG: hypothetical protein ACREU1_01050 [Burkholderiales bacterium]